MRHSRHIDRLEDFRLIIARCPRVSILQWALSIDTSRAIEGVIPADIATEVASAEVALFTWWRVHMLQPKMLKEKTPVDNYLELLRALGEYREFLRKELLRALGC